jgi:hypothetical protein
MERKGHRMIVLRFGGDTAVHLPMLRGHVPMTGTEVGRGIATAEYVTPSFAG